MENQNFNPQPINPVQKPVAPQVSDISPTLPPHSKSKMIIVLIFLFILIFLISAVALGMKYLNDSKKETVLIPTPSPTMTEDPTADWQVFEGNGFSIKYPEDWKILTEIVDNNPNAYPHFYEIIEEKEYNFLYNSNTYDFVSFKSVKKSATLSDVKKFITEEYIASDHNKQNFKIDGTDVTLYTGCLNPEVCERINAYLIPLKDGSYMLLGASDNSTIIDQILSTFKFTE